MPNRTYTSRLPIAICVCFALALGGCQNMRQEGCLVGGAIGAGAATAAGGNDTRNALVGFIVGCMIGTNYAQWVENEKRKYASAQAFYDAEIQATSQYNEQLERYNAAMQTEIAQLDQSSAELEAQYHSGQAKRRDLEKQRKVLSERKAQVDSALSAAEERLKQKEAVLADMKKYGADQGAAALSAEIAKLTDSIVKLRGQSTAIGQINNRLRL